MSRLLMLVALFGFCIGCGPAAPDTQSQEDMDAQIDSGCDPSAEMGSDTKPEGEEAADAGEGN